MKNRRLRFSSVRSEPVIMDGGLNENVSSIELKGGELIAGYNYQLVEGSQGGYISVAGYERFDGTEKPSSIGATDDDHVDQDAARELITEVPGSGNVLGVHIFEGKVYAFRNAEGGATAAMFVATATGWDEIDTSGDPLEPDGNYKFFNYNFTGDPNDFSMYWVDGENATRAFDGTTVTVISNAGMGADDKPINLIAHNDRLWLAYVGGSLQYSTAGDPADWTTSAGEFGMGREITNLIASVGNTLIVFCDEAIKIVNGYSAEDFVVESYSNFSGAYSNTAQRVFGTVIFMDDRGVTSLEAAQEFGDFKSNSLSQRVQKTLQNNKQSIACSVVSRSLNQYRLYFSNGGALYFSFLNKKLRGVTVIDFIKPVLTVTEGEDANGDIVIFFTSTDGYVYQMDIGTSFDGVAIDTLMSTAFYHYKSPRNWKRFKEVTFEIASISDLTVNIRFSFDYVSGYIPRSGIMQIDLTGAGARYGEGVWGTMRYSGSENTNMIKYPINGLAANMSVTIRTSEAYKRQHTVQNLITDFQLCGRQL